MPDIHIAANGNDTNTGHDPLNPRATLPDALNAGDTVLFRRGDIFRFNAYCYNNCVYGAYGDGETAPVLHALDIENPLFDARGVGGVTMFDLTLSGSADRLFYGFGKGGHRFTNLDLVNTPDNAAASLYFKACNGVLVHNCRNRNTGGDVVYACFTHNLTVQDGHFELPNGPRADIIQITDEGKFAHSQGCRILNNYGYKGRTPNNAKGAFALEGCKDLEVLGNNVEGMFFGIQASGEDILVKGNIVRAVHFTHSGVFGIGAAVDDVIRNVEVVDNTVESALRGIIVSRGSDGDWPVRDNVNVYNNILTECAKGLFVDVPVKGRFEGENVFNSCDIDEDIRNQNPTIFSIQYDGAGRSYTSNNESLKELIFYIEEFKQKILTEGIDIVKKL